jgi:hypothetical protein
MATQTLDLRGEVEGPTGAGARERIGTVLAGCHVRLRVRESVPSLRARRFLAEFRRALRPAAEHGQRVFGVHGRVLFGRYWLRILRTPREVRNALAYCSDA